MTTADAAAQIPPDDWSFAACAARLHVATRIVLDKEIDYDRAAKRAADAEAVYRQQLGVAFADLRSQGEAVEAAKIAAHAKCAKLSHERDYSRDLVKLAAEKLDDARDSRRSLWRLIEWARGRDLAAHGTSSDEREPASSWP